MGENNKKILKGLGGLFLCFILLIVIALVEHPVLLKYPGAILLLVWIAAKSILIPLIILQIIVGIWILIYRKHKKSREYKLDL